MEITVMSELKIRASTPCTIILNLAAAKFHRQVVSQEQFILSPAVSVENHEMQESGVRYARFKLQPGGCTVIYSALVNNNPEVADPIDVEQIEVEDLPMSVLPYIFPSRYCQSDRLGRFAHGEFSRWPAGHSRVAAISSWIYDHIQYVAGSSDAHTSVHETLVERAGVCRDFAHLGIAFCRALGIPARFISCYAVGLFPPDFHAVFEAYLGGRWYIFDATRQAALEGLVRIGVGRDAAEVSIATIFGDAQFGSPNVSARASQGVQIPHTVLAISYSDI